MRDNDDITKEIMEAGFTRALGAAAKLGAKAVGAAGQGLTRAALNTDVGAKALGTYQATNAYRQIVADWSRYAGSQGGFRGMKTTPDNLAAFAQAVYDIKPEMITSLMSPLMTQYGFVDDEEEAPEAPEAPVFGKRKTPPRAPAAANAGTNSAVPPNPPATPGSVQGAARSSAAAAAPGAPEAPASPPEASVRPAGDPEASASPPEASVSPKAPAGAPAANSSPTRAPAAPAARSFGQRQGPGHTASGREVPADRITRIDPATGKPLYRHNSHGVNFDDPTLNDPDLTTKSSKQTAQARRDATRRAKTLQLSGDVAASRRARTESVINPVTQSFSQIVAEAGYGQETTVNLRDIEKARLKTAQGRASRDKWNARGDAVANKVGQWAADAAVVHNTAEFGKAFFMRLARLVTSNPAAYRAFMGKTGGKYDGHWMQREHGGSGTERTISTDAVNTILKKQMRVAPDALDKVRTEIRGLSARDAVKKIKSLDDDLAAQVLVALLKAQEK